MKPEAPSCEDQRDPPRSISISTERNTPRGARVHHAGAREIDEILRYRSQREPAAKIREESSAEWSLGFG